MLTLTVLLKNLTATATITHLLTDAEHNNLIEKYPNHVIAIDIVMTLLTDAEHKNLTEKYPNHVTDTDVVTTSLTDAEHNNLTDSDITCWA